MKKGTECAICAWRQDCKLKYTFEKSGGLNCREFTKDVSLFPDDSDEKKASEEAKQKAS